MTTFHSRFQQLITYGHARVSHFRNVYDRFKQQYPRWHLTFRIILWGLGAGMAAFFLLCCFVYWGVFGPLPDYAQLAAIRNNTASQVYSEDGVILGKYYIDNRLNADFEEIAPVVIEALVATEDARFFEHGGIDIRAGFRVLFKTLVFQNESAGGGSTISQQLAKNLFPREDYSILSLPVNKIREIFTARRLERVYRKEELLHLYLNTVPFSENVYGIKVASQRFFNTSPNKLKIEEAAVLVGMLKGTSVYNPAKYPERSLSRRNTVLSQMEKYGYLTKPATDSLQKLPLVLDYHPESRFQGLATYFREHLRLELTEILRHYPKPDGTSYNLYTDGLKIHTTVDGRLQAFAEEAVAGHMKKLQKTFDEHWRGKKPWGNDKVLDYAKRNSPRYKTLKNRGLNATQIDSIFKKPVQMTLFHWSGTEKRKMLSPLDSIKYYLSLLNAGFLALEPQTGKVLAWVGGIDHRYFKYDHVKSRRPVGSTFKPVVYAAALEEGIQPCAYVENQLVSYPEYKHWTPENADGKYDGVYSMEGALAHSINTVSVHIALQTGIDKIKMLAKQMGITSEIPSEPAIALGAIEASLFDMVKVYGTLANDGIRPEPYYLAHIETAEGTVIVDFEKSRKIAHEKVLSGKTTVMMTKMLQTAVDSGTAQRLRQSYGLVGGIAGKTGTTQDHSDGWFIGYTPHIVAGVWVGGQLPQIRFRSMNLGQASNTALPIWGDFYQKSVANLAFKKWTNSAFPPLADSLRMLADCPLYLDEPPFGPDNFDNRGLLSGFFDLLAKDRTSDSARSEKRSTEAERIRRQNERIKEKRARKERSGNFWDRIFGREN